MTESRRRGLRKFDVMYDVMYVYLGVTTLVSLHHDVTPSYEAALVNKSSNNSIYVLTLK